MSNDTIQFTDGDKTLALVQIQAARIAELEAALTEERVALGYSRQDADRLRAQLAAAQERERAIVELLELDHCFDPHYSMHPVTREIRQDVAKVLGIAAALAAAQQPASDGGENAA